MFKREEHCFGEYLNSYSNWKTPCQQGQNQQSSRAAHSKYEHDDLNLYVLRGLYIISYILRLLKQFTVIVRTARALHGLEVDGDFFLFLFNKKEIITKNNKITMKLSSLCHALQ